MIVYAGLLFQFCELHESGVDLLACDQFGMTCLHHAARFGRKDIVKYILQNGTKFEKNSFAIYSQK